MIAGQGIELPVAERGGGRLRVKAAPEPEDGGCFAGFAEDADVFAGGDERHGQQALFAEVPGERAHRGLSRGRIADQQRHAGGPGDRGRPRRAAGGGLTLHDALDPGPDQVADL